MSKILKNKFEDKFVFAQLVYSDKSNCQDEGRIVFTFELKPQTRTFSIRNWEKEDDKYQKIKLKYHQLHFVYDYTLKEKYVDYNINLKKSVKKIKLNMTDGIELGDMYFTETITPFETARRIHLPTISNISSGHICMGDEVILADYDPDPPNRDRYGNIYKQIMKNSEELCGLFFTTTFEHKIQKNKKCLVGKKEFYHQICGYKDSGVIQINKGKF